jgi:carbonic anhydrase/acetyltransferase-like protein (isoleucine patch superfamily)
LITEGAVIPDGSMVMGMPGKIKRELTKEEQEMIPLSAKHYIENYKKYKELYKPIK